MKKAKPTTRHAAPVKCPVMPLALRVGELWDAHAGAEVRGRTDKTGRETCELIDRLRVVIEETASFERARSPAGALFQVGLAYDAVNDLFEKIPEEDKAASRTFEKLIRFLDSAALVLRDACTVEEYQAVKDVVKVYVVLDGPDFSAPFDWREKVPKLAREYRQLKKAAPATV